MDVSQSSLFTGEGEPETVSVADLRVRPTPDYGTLGPGSDLAVQGQKFSGRPATRLSALIAAAIGIFAALLVTRNLSNHETSAEESPVPPPQAAAMDSRQLDRLRPQKQAETLLALAVNQSNGAVDQITSRVGGWQGKLQWSSQIATLTTAALNSSDMRVRQSGVEIELAAYGLSKNAASFAYLLKMADSPDHAQKIWALWALGLIGNQGVETGRVTQVLIAHLKDPDGDSRRWAVEGLALIATDEALEPLLKTMHDDPSPSVRERAACTLAQSGMFTPQQRLAVVPQFLNYTDDPALDDQTHALAFRALGEITGQHLPNDSTAWWNWYRTQGGQWPVISGQSDHRSGRFAGH